METFERWPYLLYTEADEKAFRLKYDRFIAEHLDEYETWFQKTFPLFERKPCPVAKGQPDLVIGMICLLFREGRIAISVTKSPDGRLMVERHPVSEAERRAWYEAKFPPLPPSKFYARG